MTMQTIKGYEVNVLVIRDSFSRRAQRFANNIMNTLKTIGVSKDDVKIHLDPVAIKNLPASATWYFEGYRLHYSYNGCSKYVENLYVVFKIIEFEVNKILEGEKTVEDFIYDFSESDEVEQEREEARRVLGVDEDSIDLELMNKRYKELAKEAHPDMSTGDTERFKALNRAHKILKRELA